VAQLVERPIEIVEYHRHKCQCQNCGATESADWSPAMIPGQDLGLKLQAFLGWMGNYGHLPYEKQQEMLWELGQIEIGVGTLVTTNQRVEQAIYPAVSELSEWVQQEQPNVHVDETPWSVLGLKEWLWVIAHPKFCESLRERVLSPATLVLFLTFPDKSPKAEGAGVPAMDVCIR